MNKHEKGNLNVDHTVDENPLLKERYRFRKEDRIHEIIVNSNVSQKEDGQWKSPEMAYQFNVTTEGGEMGGNATVLLPDAPRVFVVCLYLRI